MRFLLSALMVVPNAGCDRLFGLADISSGEVVGDASGFDAVVLDTLGWPTDGGVGPRPCSGTAPDEDGDGIGDDCDNCPADTNAGQGDVDRDGIGTICDPHPDHAVERLAAFFSFRTQQGVAITANGAWTTNETEGTLRQTGGAMRTLYMLDGGPWREPTVEIKLAALRRDSATGNAYAGIVLSNDGMPASVYPDSLNCRSREDSNSNAYLELGRIRDAMGTGATSTSYGGNAGVHTIVVHAARHGGPAQCDGDLGDLAPNKLSKRLLAPFDANDAAMPWVGVWTQGGTADFRSAMIVETIWP